MNMDVRDGLWVRKRGKWVCYPWTRSRLCVRLAGGDVVDRYELGPLTRDHVGLGGGSGRKKIWIQPYDRGPKGAPLAVRDHVIVDEETKD
jgi:hypothetical protein